MIIGINCGHTVSGTIGSGAVGFLNESNETRAVGYALMDKLRDCGIDVVDCTDNYASSVNENLRNICDIANRNKLDVFVSIHFNSGGGNGCEAYTYTGKNTAYASEMLNALEGLDFKNRGVKNGSHLYVVRNTNAPACLLEICFVDSAKDADLYMRLNTDKIADSLCSAICGISPDDYDDNTNNINGGLTMTQYEELKQTINHLEAMLSEVNDNLYKLSNPMIYNYIDNNMPDWAKETIEKLVSKNLLKGDENGLGLTEDMLRILVICDRTGIFD